MSRQEKTKKDLVSLVPRLTEIKGQAQTLLDEEAEKGQEFRYLHKLEDKRTTLGFRFDKFKAIANKLPEVDEAEDRLMDDVQEVLLHMENRIKREKDKIAEGKEKRNNEVKEKWEKEMMEFRQQSELDMKKRQEEWNREMEEKRQAAEERKEEFERDFRTKEQQYQNEIANLRIRSEQEVNKHVGQAHAGPLAASAKLPKLVIPKFSGDKLKWREFWDSFHASVHSNTSLAEVDKLNYLRSNLEGSALLVISGLELSKQNYDVAITLLQNRYGTVRPIIEQHYASLQTMSPTTSQTHCLRNLLDKFDMHVRSLEALGENVETSQMLSMLRFKLPSGVFSELELRKGEEEWKFGTFRTALSHYIQAHETSFSLQPSVASQPTRNLHLQPPKFSPFKNYTSHRFPVTNFLTRALISTIATQQRILQNGLTQQQTRER